MATVASIVVNLTASTSRFERAMGGAQRMTKQFVRKTKSLTRELDEIARHGRRAAMGLAALTAAGLGAVKVAADHEEAMLRVKAVAKATGEEYERLSKTTVDLSATSVYSLGQIADGMKFLAMAGFEANKIIGMMPTVTKLALVGAVDMAAAAEIATTMLAGYNLQVEELERATDILAMTVTSANTDLTNLGQAFKYAGPLAESAGVAFEETAAVVALLSNAGIKGSIAGTSLRAALNRLLSPAASATRILKRLNVETLDSEGQLRSLVDIIGDMEKGGITTSEVLRVFGLRAGPAMARLVTAGSDALREFVELLEESQGVAAQIESEQMQSFNAQMKLLKNQVAAFAGGLGNDLLPYMKTLNHLVRELVDGWRNLDNEQRQNILRIAAVSAGVLGLIAVFGLVASAVSLLVKGLTVFGIVLGFVTSPIVITLALIALGVGLLARAWEENWGNIQDKTRVVVENIQGYWERFLTWWHGTPAEKDGFTSGFDVDQGGFKHKLRAVGYAIYDAFFGAWDWIIDTTWEEKWEDVKVVLSDAWEWIKVTGAGVWDGFTNIGPVKAGIDKIKEWYWGFYTWWYGTPAEIGGLTSGLLDDEGGLKHKLQAVGYGIYDSLLGAWDWIIDTTWEDKWEDIKGILTEAFEWIKITGDSVWDGFVNLQPVRNAVNRVKEIMASLYSWWHGTPVEKGGLASGFDQYEGGFKHKLGAFWAQPLDALEMSVPELTVTTGTAILAAVGTWKILAAVYPAIAKSISKGIAALPAGGLALGKVAVASLVLSLVAGAIGWAFGDKEDREAFTEAIQESIADMDLGDAVTIPVGIMDIMTITFEFGAEGLRKMQKKVQEATEQLREWDPSTDEVPKWITDIGGALWDLVLAISEFLAEGFWLAFDLAELLLVAIDKALAKIFGPFIDLGRRIAEAILKGLNIIEDEEVIVLPAADTLEPFRHRMGRGESLVDIWEQHYQNDYPNIKDFSQKILDLNRDMENVFAYYVGQELMLPPVAEKAADGLVGTMEKLEEGFGGLLDAIYQAEGGAGATPLYGTTEFVKMGHTFAREENQQRFLALSEDLEKDSEPYYRAAALTTVLHYWDTFKKAFPEVGEQTFAELGPDMQKAFIEHLGKSYAPLSHSDVNKHWIPNVIDITRRLPEYSSGTPWTGHGPLDEVAGLVHKQEAVIPWKVLRQGPLAVLDFLGLKGFQAGRRFSIPGFGEAVTTIDSMEDMFSELGSILMSGLTTLFEMLAKAIEALAVVFVGEEGVERIKEIFEGYHKGLEDFVQRLFPEIVEEEKKEQAQTWWQIQLEALKDAFEEMNWQAPVDSFFAAFSHGLTEAESELAQFFGELSSMVRVLVTKTKDGTFEISLDWEQMLANMANWIAETLGSALARLFGGGYGVGFSYRKDLLPDIDDMVTNMESWVENHERLRQLEQSKDIATVSGIGVGAGAGAIIGSGILPGIGTAVGALIGGFLGGLGGKKISEFVTAREIEELGQKLQDDFVAIKEALGTTAQSVAQSLASAFSADTYEGFVDSFTQSLEDMTRNALITAFMSSGEMKRGLEKLSDTIAYAVLDGVIDADERESIVDLYSQITDRSKDFYNALQELGIATGETAEQMGRMNQVLRNVPSGLKIVSRRLEAAGYQVAGVAAVGGLGSTSGDHYEINITGPIYGIDDLNRQIENAIGKAQRKQRLAAHGVS